MEPIGNNLIPEANQSWNGRGQYAAPQQFGGFPSAFGGDRLTPSPPGSPFGNPYGGEGDAGGDTASAGGVFSQFLGFTQNVFSELGQLMQQLMGQNQGATGNPGGQPSAGPQQYFNNASLSSVGDPHDSFNGTTGSGQCVNGKWDNMKSHDHLITSDSIPGGFNVATTATQPNGNGITYNQQATITTNNRNTVVSMGANGTPSVTDNGQPVSLTSGQTTTLSNGETVTLNGDGSLSVGVSNGQGGTINTTLKSNGNGVDVTATANNVDLGGYLADKQDGATANQGGQGYMESPQTFPAYQSQPYQSFSQQYGASMLGENEDAQILGV